MTSLAKLSQPIPSGIFPRHRLFRLLDQKRSHPVIWITGPPGSGKTAMVSSYLDARKLTCLWYRVDEGDADIASFFYYLGLAAQKAASWKRAPLPLLTPEYLQGIPTFTRRFFEDLYGRLVLIRRPPKVVLKQEQNQEEPIIVFDNYQEVPEGASFHQVVQYGLSEVPIGMNVILISRRDPPDAFARMRANRLIEIIGWNDLRFTLKESRRMMRLRGYRRVPDQTVRQLQEKTDGWAAGIVLFTEGMKVRGREPVLSGGHVSEEIFHYFAKEVFDKGESETQDFLLRTAFLPKMSSRMAENLTRNPQAQHILSDLTRKNYFTQRHESETSLYQYHPLFREFLQVLARQTFDSITLSGLEKEAAVVLESNGQIEDAIDVLAKAKAWPDVIPLILRHAPDLVSQGRGQTLEGWLRNLPESIVEEEPWLLYWMGVCRLPFSPSQSAGSFEKAFKMFKPRHDTAGIFLALSGLFNSTTYAFGNFKPFDQWIALFDELLREFSSFPSPEIEARLATNMLNAIVLRQPQHADFEIWANKAFSLSQKSQDINLKMQTFQALVAHWLLSGEFLKAESVLDSCRELARSPDVTPLLLILLRDLEAFHHWLTAAFEENQKAVTEGLELASATGVHLLDIYLLGHGAAGVLSSGDMAAARAYLKKMALHLNNLPAWGKSFHHMISTWASLMQGDLSNALSNGELCLEFAIEAGMPQTEAVHHIGHAIVLHELNREEATADHLAKGSNLARSSRVPLAEFMCLLAEARFAFDKGNDRAGLISLKKALSMGQEKGYVNTYYWQPAVMANLCKKALEAGIEVKYVQTLIQKRHLMPDPPPYDCEYWPWPLKINTLGRFELMKNQEPIPFPSKAPRRALSLLKALIASGRKGAGEEQLADTLWPDADGDTAKQAFETTLHRLRQLLGNKKFILLREGHLKLNPLYCMVDAYAFEQLLEQAEATESIPLLEKAIDLYRGTFLGDDPGDPWALSYRERLRSKFLGSIRKLGSHFEENGQKEKAIEYYQRGLEVDSLAEEFYQQLMTCYQSEGRKAQALATYDRCRNLFQSVLGIEPSPQTEAIYESIHSPSPRTTVKSPAS